MPRLTFAERTKIEDAFRKNLDPANAPAIIFASFAYSFEDGVIEAYGGTAMRIAGSETELLHDSEDGVYISLPEKEARFRIGVFSYQHATPVIVINAKDVV